MDNRLYIHEFREGEFIEIREATSDEIFKSMELRNEINRFIKQKEEIERKLHKLIKNCEHVVCYDEPGFQFDSRICLACGHTEFI